MKNKGIIPISILSLVIVGYLLYELDVFEQLFSGDEDEIDIVAEHEEKLEDTAKIIEEERREKEDGNITKDELVLLMFSPTLHFDDVYGEYTFAYPLEKRIAEVSFALDMVEKEGMHKHKDEINNYTVFFSADPQVKITLYEQERTFRRLTWKEDLEEGQEPITDTAELFLTGGYGADPRIKINFALGHVLSSYFTGSLRYYDQWEFEETTYLGMEGYQISGKEGQFVDGETFEMFVEKNTGIVLDYTLFDKDNNEVMSLTTQKIDINEGIDPELLTPDLTDYEEVKTPDEYKDDNIIYD